MYVTSLPVTAQHSAVNGVPVPAAVITNSAFSLSPFSLHSLYSTVET